MPHLTRSMAGVLTVAALLAGTATACTTSPTAPPLELDALPPTPSARVTAPSDQELERTARKRLDTAETDDGSFVLLSSSTGSSHDQDTRVTPGRTLTADLTCTGKGTATFVLSSGKAKVSKRLDCGGTTTAGVTSVELTPATRTLDVDIDVKDGDRVGTAYRVRRQ
ncbi:hypothetical protein OG897_26025 [Streptomyces sp. NBC_00237]|uniref:hypothetical protein n=1 Tax=Streptomyces sp. NBC_00237 TaxID=2975687 RepID=UPI002254EF76|nr:hypothetical protein [Streptomyces sp. NBC_00237]MCX5204899.1 hypothetical protein [Streptomyces sp. NBC_00237]